jgi:tetratricopeptide (TPR) repeat protein
VGEYDEARNCSQQSLSIFRDLGDRAGEARSLTNLGVVAEAVGEYDDAKEWFQQGLSIKRDLDDRVGEAKSLANLGIVARRLGEFDDAREHGEAARDLFTDLGAVNNELRVRRNLVNTEWAANAMPRARERCEAALARLDNLEREFPDKREWFATMLDNIDEATGDDEFDVGKKDLRILRGYGVTIETPSWRTIAQIKGAGGISLGDSYAAALALEEEATLVVGADPKFGELSEDIDLHRIREESV